MNRFRKKIPFYSSLISLGALSFGGMAGSYLNLSVHRQISLNNTGGNSPVQIPASNRWAFNDFGDMFEKYVYINGDVGIGGWGGSAGLGSGWITNTNRWIERASSVWTVDLRNFLDLGIRNFNDDSVFNFQFNSGLQALSANTYNIPNRENNFGVYGLSDHEWKTTSTNLDGYTRDGKWVPPVNPALKLVIPWNRLRNFKSQNQAFTSTIYSGLSNYRFDNKKNKSWEYRTLQIRFLAWYQTNSNSLQFMFQTTALLSFNGGFNFSEDVRKSYYGVGIKALNFTPNYNWSAVNAGLTTLSTPIVAKSEDSGLITAMGNKAQIDSELSKRKVAFLKGLKPWNSSIEPRIIGLNSFSSTNYDSQNDEINFWFSLNIPWRQIAITQKITIKATVNLDFVKFNQKLVDKRFAIIPGKVAKIVDGKQVLVDDVPKKMGSELIDGVRAEVWEYYATAQAKFFSDAKQNNEVLFVNDAKVDVLDNYSSVILRDQKYDGYLQNLLKANNPDAGNQAGGASGVVGWNGTNKTPNTSPTEYVLKIKKDQSRDPQSEKQKENAIKTVFAVKIKVQSYVANLDLKYFAWDPEKITNAHQKNWITPKLENGKPNPAYNPNIDVKTGTIKQIIWVKQPAKVPFPNDPIRPNGNFYTDEELGKVNDFGYLAEGSVSYKGVSQNFSSDAKAGVVIKRQALSEELVPIPNQAATKIQPDTSNTYWSNTGLYAYTIGNQTEVYGQKILRIKSGTKEVIESFLATVSSDYAVDFWTTSQGKHLLYYLKEQYNLSSEQARKLPYEQVLQFWNEYVSWVIYGFLQLPKSTANFGLAQIHLNLYKTNTKDPQALKAGVLNRN